MQVDQDPVPVDAVHVEPAEVGHERVGERAGLTCESIGALRHAVADREIALLLADVQERRSRVRRTRSGNSVVISGSWVR